MSRFLTRRRVVLLALPLIGLFLAGQRSSVARVHHSKSANSPPRPNALVVVARDGRFNTLIRLVVAAGLTDALQEADGFTLFAPTDEVFAKLSQGTIEMLMQPENIEMLRELLQFHGLPTALKLVENGNPVEVKYRTLTDTPIRIERLSDRVTVKVANATVIEPNLRFDGGYIHVVDQILVPVMPEPKMNGENRFPDESDEAAGSSTPGSKPLTGMLKLVSAGGQDPIQLSDVAKAEIEIDISATGRVELTGVRAETVRVIGKGAGSVRLTGTAGNLVVDLGGAARVDASDLDASSVVVVAGGAAQAEVRVSGTLDAEVTGVSQVRYAGNPMITKKIENYAKVVALD